MSMKLKTQLLRKISTLEKSLNSSEKSDISRKVPTFKKLATLGKNIFGRKSKKQ